MLIVCRKVVDPYGRLLARAHALNSRYLGLKFEFLYPLFSVSLSVPLFPIVDTSLTDLITFPGTLSPSVYDRVDPRYHQSSLRVRLTRVTVTPAVFAKELGCSCTASGANTLPASAR